MQVKDPYRFYPHACKLILQTHRNVHLRRITGVTRNKNKTNQYVQNTYSNGMRQFYPHSLFYTPALVFVFSSNERRESSVRRESMVRRMSNVRRESQPDTGRRESTVRRESTIQRDNSLLEEEEEEEEDGDDVRENELRQELMRIEKKKRETAGQESDDGSDTDLEIEGLSV